MRTPHKKRLAGHELHSPTRTPTHREASRRREGGVSAGAVTRNLAGMLPIIATGEPASKALASCNRATCSAVDCKEAAPRFSPSHCSMRAKVARIRPDCARGGSCLGHHDLGSRYRRDLGDARRTLAAARSRCRDDRGSTQRRDRRARRGASTEGRSNPVERRHGSARR